MSIIFGILIGLLVLMFLVVMHELGHFWAARRNGVEVEEFGVGFLPRAIAWRKKDGKWRKLKRGEWEQPTGKGLIISLNWLPIGGFCKMKGESNADVRKGSFGRASMWGKTKILFGGVVANWAVAAVVLTILAWTGMPHFVEGQFVVEGDVRVEARPVVIAGVMEGSPAERAGLEAGDEIVMMGMWCSSDGRSPIWKDCADKVVVREASDVTEFNERHSFGDMKMREIAIEYMRGGRYESTWVQLNEAGSEYLLGVTMSQEGTPLYRSTWSAPVVGVGTMVQLTGETFKGLGELVWNLVSGVVMQVNFDENVRGEGAANIGKVGESVSGPVGIVGMVFPAFAESGVTNLAFLAAIISISLACMNVLPIPALDGGRWMLIAIYKLRKKKLTSEVEERVVGRAFMVLIGLIVIITVLDVMRIAR